MNKIAKLGMLIIIVSIIGGIAIYIERYSLTQFIELLYNLSPIIFLVALSAGITIFFYGLFSANDNE